MPSRSRSRQVYTLLGEDNNLGDKTRFINLGYWKKAATYDEAAKDLALEVGKAAKFKPNDIVLDVGCGFGEQDKLWMDLYEVKEIQAINITPIHIEKAISANVHDNIKFRVASATDLPYSNSSFDKVIALESAFHFDTREVFFYQAYRVMRSDGMLVLADVIPKKTPKKFIEKFKFWFGGGLWQVPQENNYDFKTYKEKLEQAGFSEVEVNDISEYVWSPFKEFAMKRVKDPEIKERVHPILRKIWGTSHPGVDELRYIIVTAIKK